MQASILVEAPPGVEQNSDSDGVAQVIAFKRGRTLDQSIELAVKTVQKLIEDCLLYTSDAADE